MKLESVTQENIHDFILYQHQIGRDITGLRDAKWEELGIDSALPKAAIDTIHAFEIVETAESNIASTYKRNSHRRDQDISYHGAELDGAKQVLVNAGTVLSDEAMSTLKNGYSQTMPFVPQTDRERFLELLETPVDHLSKIVNFTTASDSPEFKSVIKDVDVVTDATSYAMAYRAVNELDPYDVEFMYAPETLSTINAMYSVIEDDYEAILEHLESPVEKEITTSIDELDIPDYAQDLAKSYGTDLTGKELDSFMTELEILSDSRGLAR